MAKASDNAYPSVLLVEGSTPASPAAGRQRLFVRSSDHALAMVDSSGTAAPVSLVDPAPTVPGTLDDEFNGTDTSDPMAGWTTLQTPTSHDINSTVTGHYRVQKTAVNSSAGNVGIYKAWSPAAGHQIVTKITDCALSFNNFQTGAMLFVGTATPGALECARLFYNGTNIVVGATAYSGPGVPATALATVGGTWHRACPLWLRVTFNSATSIDWHYSLSGLVWNAILLARNPGFTIGSVGLAIDTQQASVDGEAIFAYIRSNF